MAEATRVVPSVWTTGWTDILNTGTWRSAIPVHQKRLAPCHVACPLDSEIPTWIKFAREQSYQEAWLALVANNPFPAVTGRICHHPCEGGCNRGEYDGAVAVNALEQYVGDLALREGWSLPQPAPDLEQRVAVIGGGPAGLSCAYQLRQQGYQVTLLEARSKLGGVLREGIPQYRLPREILEGEIERLLALGMEVRTNHPVEAEDLDSLEKEFSAIFLAIGAQRAKMLPQFPANDPRIIDALHFLVRINQGEVPSLGQQVVVIGGGSVALDAAASARRLGSQVKVLALEDRESLPARADELAEALAEGVELIAGAMVQSVVLSEEGIRLDCIGVSLAGTAPAGVLKPILLPGTEFKVLTGHVILAVGQEAELTGWDTVLTVGQSLVKVDANGATDRPGVFAGGDVTATERYVSTAMGQGKRAARSMHEFLRGEFPATGSSGAEVPDPGEVVSYQEINTFYFPSISRENKGTVAVEQRLRDFREIKIGFTTQQAQTQAERCFSCGHCVECDNCFYFCPDMAVVKDASLAEHYHILDQYCKGCGSCVEECPRGAVVLKEETR